MLSAISTLLCLMPVAEPQTEVGLTLVVVYRLDSPGCMQMAPILERVGRRVRMVYADASDPRNVNQLERFRVNPKLLPHIIAYRGHEALEVWAGVLPEEGLNDWVSRLSKGEASALGPSPSTVQQFLGPEDRPYLRRRLTPGTCGMLGCAAHGGGFVLEFIPKGAP